MNFSCCIQNVWNITENNGDRPADIPTCFSNGTAFFKAVGRNWANKLYVKSNYNLLTLWIQLDFTLITAGEVLFSRLSNFSVFTKRQSLRSRNSLGKLTCPNTVRNLQQAKFDDSMYDWLLKSRQCTYNNGEPESSEAFTSSNSMVNEGSRVQLNSII